MRVLVCCEYSGRVSGAFRARGHDAWSNDLLPADRDLDRPHHIQGDYTEAIARGGWDIIVGHPPCTTIAVSGNRFYSGTPERESGIKFVVNMAERFTVAARLGWAIENPVGVLSSRWRKPTQYIQPWQFGHGETKKTGLWLHGLPPLEPTNVVDGREQRIWKMGPSADRWKLRSETFQGIADAMAAQWGAVR